MSGALPKTRPLSAGGGPPEALDRALAEALSTMMTEALVSALAQAKTEVSSWANERAQVEPATTPSPTVVSGPPKQLGNTDPGRKLAYTMNEAAAAVGLSRRNLYNMVSAGELTTFKWGGRTLIHADVLRAAIGRASGRAGEAASPRADADC